MWRKATGEPTWSSPKILDVKEESLDKVGLGRWQSQFQAFGLTERVENCSKSLLISLLAIPVINLIVARRVIIPDDMDSVS